MVFLSEVYTRFRWWGVIISRLKINHKNAHEFGDKKTILELFPNWNLTNSRFQATNFQQIWRNFYRFSIECFETCLNIQGRSFVICSRFRFQLKSEKKLWDSGLLSINRWRKTKRATLLARGNKENFEIISWKNMLLDIWENIYIISWSTVN